MSTANGGRKTPVDPRLRARAVKLAERIGAADAAARMGLRPGTVRSWLARKAHKEEAEREGANVLEQLKAVGREMLRRQAEQAARSPERE